MTKVEKAPSLLCNSLHIDADRGLFLIIKYLQVPWEQFQNGQVTSGQVLAAITELDELPTNEKVFLASHFSNHVTTLQIREYFLTGQSIKFLQTLGLE